MIARSNRATEGYNKGPIVNPVRQAIIVIVIAERVNNTFFNEDLPRSCFVAHKATR
jgi:hypothetical protein